ncbi:hypothetical protein STEG23_023326, partial [Scotinomys teguina]
GWVGAEIGNTIERFDPDENKWEVVGNMAVSRYYFGCCEMQGLIYVIGGISNEGLELRSFEVYDPLSKRWSPLPPMGTRRAYLGVAALNDCIYSIGGWNEAQDALHTVEKYSFEEPESGNNLDAPQLKNGLRKCSTVTQWSTTQQRKNNDIMKFAGKWMELENILSKSSTATLDKQGEHLPRGEGRFGVSRRRHNSSDGFFNNGPLRTTGDSWHQSSLFRHDSVDSGVSKGAYSGTIGNLSGWHGSSRGHDGIGQRSGGSTGSHRHWNGSFHSRKGCAFQEKPPTEIREEKKDDKVEKLQFEEEDFPSLKPEAGKQNQPCRPIGTPSGVWENPPSAKQPSKMLVIKKVSKEDPAAAFSAAFTSSGSHHANGNKVSTMISSVYKNLVPKPAPPPSKPNAWKANRMEHKSGSLSSSRESAFTNPISVTKPVVLAAGIVLNSPKEIGFYVAHADSEDNLQRLILLPVPPVHKY